MKTIPQGVSGRFSLTKRKPKVKYNLDLKTNERGQPKDMHPGVSEGMLHVGIKKFTINF